VQQRIAYLSTDARRLITLAAVAGRRFNVTLLQEIMHCDESHLLTLLKEVVAAQLVVEEGVDQFAFRHALTQQAIIDSLLLRERQGLHRRNGFLPPLLPCERATWKIWPTIAMKRACGSKRWPMRKKQAKKP
jgi:predicted ATPase